MAVYSLKTAIIPAQTSRKKKISYRGEMAEKQLTGTTLPYIISLYLS
jgi:hypothetical protein